MCHNVHSFWISTLWPGGTRNLPSPAQSRSDLGNLRGFSGSFHWLLRGGRLLSQVIRVFIIWILIVIGLTLSFWVLKSTAPIQRRRQMYYQSHLSTALPQLGWKSRCHKALSSPRGPLPARLNKPQKPSMGMDDPTQS